MGDDASAKGEGHVGEEAVGAVGITAANTQGEGRGRRLGLLEDVIRRGLRDGDTRVEKAAVGLEDVDLLGSIVGQSIAVTARGRRKKRRWRIGKT